MLTLIEGGFGSVSHGELLTRIKRSVDMGRRTYLFVPEQQTLVCEGEMCEVLPASAPQIFEVTNFTRFANTAFRILGGIGGKYCTGAETSLVMWRVLNELAPLLSMTRGRRSPAAGTVERALGAVREMQSHGISPEELSAVKDDPSIRDARLRAKLSDLAMIYSLYRELVGEKYNDLGEDTEMLASKLSENPEFLDGVDIYIDGFISFTEPQYKLIGVMMRATAVTVTLTLPRARADAFEYSEVKKAEERLKELARKNAVDIKLARTDAPDPRWRPEIRAAADMLFATGGVIDNDCLHELKKGGGRVKIYEAHDPFEECDFVAADIKRRVMDGASYSDIAIIARSADKYVGILDAALDRAGVPHFISKRTSINSFEAIKLINTAYNIVNRGFRREDVLTYAKCGLAGITRERCDEFELYVCRWSIEGQRFTDGVAWNMNPRGYREYTEADHETLARLDRTREKLLTPLVNFREAVDGAKTVRDQAVALIDFLGEIKLEKCLYQRAKELHEMGEYESAEENARLWQTICESLDTLVGVLGECEVGTEDFASLLSVVFDGASIARLPLAKDQVTVGSADMLRIREKRWVYLIGVNAGEFPAGVSDTSYFNERDKATLKSLDLPIEPDLTIRNARELYCFARAFSSGRDGVTLIYTKTSAAMSPILPSEVIGRIVEMTGEQIPVVKIDTLPLGERVFSPIDAIMLSSKIPKSEYPEVRDALVESGLESILTVAEGNPINREKVLGKDALALIYRGDVYMSQSRLDSFRSCPFSYFAKYVLHLSEERRSELSADVIGIFIHSVLEVFFKTVYEGGGSVADLTDLRRAEIAELASRSYIEDILGGGFGEARTENVIERLCRAARPVIDGLCEELGNCKYRPVFFELSTEGKESDAPDPLTIDLDGESKLVISGFVDRVDSLKVGDDVYVRVVDYKSGSKSFSPADLAKGENLQMFLYLKSIVDTDKPEFLEKMGVTGKGGLVPAGVMYVKTSLRDVTVDTASDEDAEKARRELSGREGMLLDDEMSIGAMNPYYLPDGVTDPESAYRYSREGWDEISRTVEGVVVELAKRMKSGDISANPKIQGSKSPCTYCPYKPICRTVRKK